MFSNNNVGELSTSEISYDTVGRIVHIRPSERTVERFLSRVRNISIDDLKKRSFLRTICSRELLEEFGNEFKSHLHSIVRNYDNGCAIVHFGMQDSTESYVKLATAISHLLSRPIPEPSGEYYGITNVLHTDSPSIKLLDPYRPFTMHTDGVFADNPVDWHTMMKIDEVNASGGETRLLHVADLAEFEDLRSMPSGTDEFCFGLEEKDNRYDILSRASSMEKKYSQILSERDGRRSIKFVDQFMVVDSIDQATVVEAVQQALEQSDSIVEVPLELGSMSIIDNTVWAHGRAPFERHTGLSRTLLRQYGYFPENHPEVQR